MSLASPLDYLHSAGGTADVILPLTWATLAISVLVVIVIAALLWIGVSRVRARGGPDEMRAVPVQAGANGMRWIKVGVAIAVIPLFITLVWTMVALAGISRGGPANAIVLDVTPRQWWWDVRYSSPTDPSQTFSTANEIHIPVGLPVKVRLHGADVIHSFWVPKLAGKTDAIPGRINVTWLRASAPGRYRGQCSEFCGFQHAHMALDVVAESPTAFENWRQQQLAPAPEPTTPEQMRGREFVVYRCGLCHSVRGTTAAATAAPDLTHLLSRSQIAAGTLPTNVGNIATWIRNSQAFKPGNLMPNQNMTGPELADTLAYLELLR
jgi:cytochrome c oxidase subunit 2